MNNLLNIKELQDQTNYYDYGFRQYDAQLGRWHVIDAMAENYFSTSPYAYVMNDPINHTDIAGLYRGGGNQWTSYPRPYIDSNSSRVGGEGMNFRNNMPRTLMGLNLAHYYNPYRNPGGSFEDYWKKVNGELVYTGYGDENLKGKFGSDANGNLYSLSIEGLPTISFKDGTKVSDIITTNADGSKGINWEGLANYFGDNDFESSTGGDNPDTGKEMGPIGVGISIELAFPGMKRIYGHRGMGISFGFVADVKGLSWYYTRKTAERGLACSISPEAFYVDGVDGKVYNDILNNYGYSESAGYGPYGIEFGADNGADFGQKPKYYQYSLSGFAKGFDYSAVSWKTYTTITNLVYP